MNRDEQEMALWREAYNASRHITRAGVEAEADAAVEAFRKRFPPQSSAPEAVWYDEPPFAKDGSVSPAWIFDYPFPILVAYFGDGWAYEVPGRSNRWHPLSGRPVSPITKPPEPTP